MNWLAGFLPDLRSGERRLAVLMSANYFLLLLFYYLLKPARDSLFLVQISPEQLPLAYILTALVAAPVTSPRDGRFLEQLGTYDPLPDPPHVKLKRDRIRHWLLPLQLFR